MYPGCIIEAKRPVLPTASMPAPQSKPLADHVFTGLELRPLADHVSARTTIAIEANLPLPAQNAKHSTQSKLQSFFGSAAGGLPRGTTPVHPAGQHLQQAFRHLWTISKTAQAQKVRDTLELYCNINVVSRFIRTSHMCHFCLL